MERCPSAAANIMAIYQIDLGLVGQQKGHRIAVFSGRCKHEGGSAGPVPQVRRRPRHQQFPNDPRVPVKGADHEHGAPVPIALIGVGSRVQSLPDQTGLAVQSSLKGYIEGNDQRLRGLSDGLPGGGSFPVLIATTSPQKKTEEESRKLGRGQFARWLDSALCSSESREPNAFPATWYFLAHEKSTDRIN